MQKKLENNANAFYTENTYFSMEVTLSKKTFYLLQFMRDYFIKMRISRIFLSNLIRMMEFHITVWRGTPSIVRPVWIV